MYYYLGIKRSATTGNGGNNCSSCGIGNGGNGTGTFNEGFSINNSSVCWNPGENLALK